MSQQREPSGSEVSKVESDIAQTVTLADTVVSLIKEPVTLLYQNIKKSQQLRLSLGPWQEEALDENTQYRIPVLRREEFERYMVKIDGIVSACIPTADQKIPTTKAFGKLASLRLSWGSKKSQDTISKLKRPPTGSGCWVYFLYALGIGPGMGVVGWRPSIGGFVSTQNGGIEMECEGSVLCHIINLYGTGPGLRFEKQRLSDRRLEKSCKFPFGKLAWEKADGQFHAHFQPGLETELDGRKQPFDDLGSRMEPETLVISYFMALRHGISDSDFRLAESTAPLKTRIEVFLRCLNKLKDYSGKPLLLSYDWFEEAARVKRRVLARGGEDHSFFNDICKAIDNEAQLSRAERGRVKDHVRQLFLLDKETFTFWVRGSRPDSRPNYERLPFRLARNILQQYQSEPMDTWKRELHDMKEQVLSVLSVSNDIIIESNMWLLEFTDTCSLWNETVLLGAPTRP